MKGFVAVTDADWIAHLRSTKATEANFWQPRPTRIAMPEWTPWIFKVRRTNLVAGCAFFSYWTIMPLSIAWETFGEANGVVSYGDMLRRVGGLRREMPTDDNVGCVVLSNVVILDRPDWIPAPADWHPNIVRGASYDLAVGEGARVWDQLRSALLAQTQPGLQLSVPGASALQVVSARRGQGAFRLMVMDAYARRCAISGERTLPVLEAAHIRPFAVQQLHEVRNGILMRSDIHRLYDRGLVTVAADLTFRVSRSIERDYSNGRIYYELDGKRFPYRKIARCNLTQLHSAGIAAKSSARKRKNRGPFS
jgi:putative restriction endonuclease